nr:hypothetical protein CFP56_67615 [Quercus suber]
MPGRPPMQPSSSRSSQSQVQTVDQSSMVMISAENLRNIEERVETLDHMVRALQAQQGNAPASSEELYSREPPHPSAHEPESLVGATGHLSLQDGERVRYVEPTFWATMSSEVSQLEELIGSQTRDTLERAAEERVSNPDDFREGDTSEQSGEVMGELQSPSSPDHISDYD